MVITVDECDHCDAQNDLTQAWLLTRPEATLTKPLPLIRRSFSEQVSHVQKKQKHAKL